MPAGNGRRARRRHAGERNRLDVLIGFIGCYLWGFLYTVTSTKHQKYHAVRRSNIFYTYNILSSFGVNIRSYRPAIRCFVRCASSVGRRQPAESIIIWQYDTANDDASAVMPVNHCYFFLISRVDTETWFWSRNKK